MEKPTHVKSNLSTAIIPLEFEERQVRRTVDPKTGEVLFSVVDIVGILTDSQNPRRYWSDLKKRLKKEGSQLYEKIVQLKLTSQDGKGYRTDVASMETVLRLIQSIPSAKAEPFKLWLAKVGRERLEEEADPSLAVDRAIGSYKRRGRNAEWIKARMKGIVKRNELTDACKDRGISDPREYAKLTDKSYKGWSGWNASEFKAAKGLPSRVNLRDHMTAPQLTVTEVAEDSAMYIMAERDAQGYDEVSDAVKAGAFVALHTRAALERVLGRSIVEGKPALPQVPTK